MVRPKPSPEAKRYVLEDALKRTGDDDLLVRFGLISENEAASDQAIRDRRERIAKQARALAAK